MYSITCIICNSTYTTQFRTSIKNWLKKPSSYMIMVEPTQQTQSRMLSYVSGKKFHNTLPILLISIYVTMTNFPNWSSLLWYTTCIWRGHFNMMTMVYVVLSSSLAIKCTQSSKLFWRLMYSVYCTIKIYFGCHNKLNTQLLPVVPVHAPSSDGNTCHMFSNIYVPFTMLPWHV